MALACVIPTCQPTISDAVFKFPISKVKREKWLAALNLDINYEFVKPTGVCQRHFRSTYFKKAGPITLLALNAIPELNVQSRIMPQIKLENKIQSNTATAVTNVTYSNNASNIPLQSSSINHSVVKMEIDEKPQLGLNKIDTVEIPIALPMIEPDSIKIEIENVESNVPDPLDPHLDRIQGIKNRNKGNSKLQVKMKELKAKIRQEKKKINHIKCNLKRNISSYNKLIEQHKLYNEDIIKISKLRNIYINPELTIPRLMYDRFGMIEFDGLKYPNELKQFAIELYSKSPIAYDYVRESLCNVIPHPDAILRWTKPPETTDNED